MALSDTRPWRQFYPEGTAETIEIEHDSPLEAFRHASRAEPNAPLLTYFDTVLTFGEVDRMSDALAVALLKKGVEPGDRVGVYMQNNPQHVIALLAGWKVGATHVALNPMLRATELRYHLDDSTPVVLVTLDELWEDVGQQATPGTSVRSVITASARQLQSRNDARVLPDHPRSTTEGAEDMQALLDEHDGQKPRPRRSDPEAPAFICYTSGTSGDPKGSVSTNRNVVALSQIVRDVFGLHQDGPMLGLAPLFHITGLVVQLIPCFFSRSPIVLSHRFHPGVMLDSIREHRPTHAVGAITAFIALISQPDSAREDFVSFERIYSGGAPISPATSMAFLEFTGHQLLGAYGMTEATGATCLGPAETPAPVDPSTGALAVGIPIPGTITRVVDDAGHEVAPGTSGEVVFESPGVTPGYWNRPEATADAIRQGVLYTGDIGVMNEDGWVFLVDRKKDLINASGFKVWPREVEDALYENPDVREVAVVGVPDDYRGESVKAFAALREGSQQTPESLSAFLTDRLAAYKRPSAIELMDELPKTASGKILRRRLRPASTGLSAASVTTRDET